RSGTATKSTKTPRLLSVRAGPPFRRGHAQARVRPWTCSRARVRLHVQGMTDDAPNDPIAYFSMLFKQASERLAEAEAMVLSPVDADGRPSGRYVLLKTVDSRGFVFFTNLGSRKARALRAHPGAALPLCRPPQ